MYGAQANNVGTASLLRAVGLSESRGSFQFSKRGRWSGVWSSALAAILPTVWSKITNTAVVSYTSDILQNDVGKHFSFIYYGTFAEALRNVFVAREQKRKRQREGERERELFWGTSAGGGCKQS